MIRISFKNPYLILVFALVVAVLSAVFIPRMPADILPQFRKSAMQIIVLYPGMPAKVVEKDITSRMERWTGQSPGIEKQVSKSMMGVSIVTDYFTEGISPAEAISNASSYANSDMYYQPPGTLPPMVQPFDPTASKPLMLLTVSSPTRSGKELYDLAYYSLRQMLSGVKGIIAPAAYGGSLRRIYIYVDPARLEALGISQTDIARALRENTTMIPSGIAQIGEVNYAVDIKGMIRKVEDFNKIIVAIRNGKPVYIRDIGYAKDASAIQTNIVRVDGKEQVYLPIFKRPNANTIAAVNAVKKSLPRLRERMPADVEMNVIFDQSSYVKRAISGLAYAGFGGLLLVVLVLFLFLGNFRSSFIVALSLPLSLLFATIVLYFTGQAFNTITLGGLALVIGLLVDNSIVVLENIDRHLLMKKKKARAALDATLEVGMPVLASTLVIVVVFFPILFLTGITKYLFTPLAITVAASMLGSYLFSLTLIPLAAVYLYKERTAITAPRLTAFQRLIEKGKERYEQSLRFILRRRWPVLGFTFLAFLASLFLLGSLGFELFPKSDVGQMEIQVRLESGTPLEKSNEVITRMEAVIHEELGSELRQIVSNIGIFYDLPAAYTPNSGTQDAFIKVQLQEDHKISVFDYVSRLRQRFHRDFPGAEVSFNTGGMVTAALNDGKPAPIDVRIKGDDFGKLRSIAERIRDTIRSIPATRDVRILQRNDQPTKNIDLDREKASLLGVEPVDAIKNMVSALNSSATYEKAFWIDERNGNHYYVGVTYPEHEIRKEQVLENVTVGTKDGKDAVLFREFADISDTRSPVEINHHNLTRAYNVYANVEGSDIGSVSAEIRRRLKRMDFPPGYRVDFEGEVAVMENSFGDMALGLALALILAYLIITPLFRSFRLPLVILFAFPLGIIGVALLMWITGTYLNIQSIMGIIMMVGISVSYGNILIDRMNKLLEEGKGLRDAIIRGSADRFRPVLMTAFTTIFGLLPTALGISRGAESNIPLAIAVIGGTFMATLLTLYIIPVLYSLIVKVKAPAHEPE